MWRPFLGSEARRRDASAKASRGDRGQPLAVKLSRAVRVCQSRRHATIDRMLPPGILIALLLGRQPAPALPFDATKSATPLPPTPTGMVETATTSPQPSPTAIPATETPAPTPVSTPTLLPTPTPTAFALTSGQTACPSTASRLRIGDKLRVLSRLNFRSGPGLNWPIILTNNPGVSMQVIGGPVCTRLSDSQDARAYLWWNVQMENGQLGWSAEGSLLSPTYFVAPIH